ncbi:hypothetical protein OH492_08420 [Vibrio chagasii]|nr:hypothetical protein [Vibrio chagasii]
MKVPSRLVWCSIEGPVKPNIVVTTSSPGIAAVMITQQWLQAREALTGAT